MFPKGKILVIDIVSQIRLSTRNLCINFNVKLTIVIIYGYASLVFLVIYLRMIVFTPRSAGCNKALVDSTNVNVCVSISFVGIAAKILFITIN